MPRPLGLALVVLVSARVGLAMDCRDPASDCTLRETAEQVGVYYGAAISPAPLAADPAYGPAFVRETNSLTLENHLKWNLVHPAPGVWDFSVADQLIDFAAANGMRIRGHTLVWDQDLVDSTPAWVTAITDPAELRAVLAEHVQTVVGRYRGRIETWDVVNEPIETVGAALYDNVFHRLLGPGYIAEALALAHAADPDAALVVNEVLVERAGAKFDALLALAEELLAAGAPLHGIGLQGHFFGAPVAAELQANVEAVAALGLRVELTEVDVLLRGDGDLATRLARQRDDYRSIAAACMAVPACVGLTTWGITDARTWIDSFIGPGFAPLPLDESYARKPAYFGLREGLAARASRAAVSGRRLVLREGRSPARRRIVFSSRDGAIAAGAGPGSLDDPTLAGGTLRVAATGGDGFDATYDLPAAGWRPLRPERPQPGWLYEGDGPVRTVRLLAGSRLDVVATGAALGHSLAAEPVHVDVQITIGAFRHCARFGGATRFVAGRRFVAKNASAPIACDALAP